MLLAGLLALASVASGCASDPRPQATHDVVIWRATSAGLAAAVQAARSGKSVLVLEASPWIGGLSASGLGATDVGNKDAIGGIARDFYRAVREWYARDEAWVAERREDFRGRGHRESADAAWTFEPKVATRIFEEWALREGIEVRRSVRLDLQRIEFAPTWGQAQRIAALFDEHGRRYEGRMFIDASYEGDLLALAKVSYVVGREANSDFGETLNGVQKELGVAHQFVRDVDPYRVSGDASSGLLPGIEAEIPGPEGAADHKVQAYCYRICATDHEATRLPWRKPEGYDETAYELLFRNFEAGDLRRPWHPVLMPNRKTDSNNNFAVSTDFIGQNWSYAEAGWAERERIEAAHRSWQQGLLWTLAEHPRVPLEVRNDFQRWGLCRDEFTDNGGWPYQLYVREGRRMRSDVVLTEGHVRGERPVEDPVGLGAYGMDSHHVQRYVDADGHVRNEGDVQVRGFDPYGISYRAIVPSRGQASNLLVPVAVSATHIAYGSIRMEPVFMVLGQAAATAACMSLDRGVAVQDLGYNELREQLLRDGMILEWKRR